MQITIPEKEIKIKFIRASGPGGQNVNRRATKVQIHWNIIKSKALTEKQRFLICKNLKNLITKTGEIIIEDETTRSQAQNREIVIEKLHKIINNALKKKKKRIPTKPSKKVKERILEAKKKHSQKKKERQIEKNILKKYL